MTLLDRVQSVYGDVSARVSAAFVDRRVGVETTRQVSVEELGHANYHYIHYVPSRWRALRGILAPDEVGPDDVFLDIGSGKGRVMLQAAEYPFKRVTGVELSEDMTRVARRNFDRARSNLRCHDLRVVVCNAIDYDIDDDVSVVYLYNPIVGDAFDVVVAKILESFDRAPRLIRIIYRNPAEQSRLEHTGRIHRIRSRRDFRTGMRSLDTAVDRMLGPRGCLTNMYVVTPAARPETIDLTDSSPHPSTSDPEPVASGS